MAVRPSRWEPSANASGGPRLRGRWKLLAAGVVIGIHAGILLALLHAHPRLMQPFQDEGVKVALQPLLVPPPPLDPQPPPPEAKATSKPAQAKPSSPVRSPAPAAPHMTVHPAPAPPDIKPLIVATTTPAPPAPQLSEAEFAGALVAGPGEGEGAGGLGSGAGEGRGRSCDMIRRLQSALRRNARVQGAVAEARQRGEGLGRALLLWRGDWVQSSGEEGKGLAGVRQAIITEVAFAPEACRTQAMRGYVLISLADGPGSARLALGAPAWRWSDLLFARGVGRR